MKISNAIKTYIESQKDKEDLAKRWNITVTTLYNLMAGKNEPSAPLIESVLRDTGFDFEKAFELN